MTPTDKQRCIAEQAIYGDFRGYDLKDTYYREHHSTIVGFQNKLVYIGCDLNRIEAIKPILRPMSDLTKEITHKGYNDDKPFVPINVICRWFVDNREVVNTYNLLHLWHFDTRNLIDKDEAIDVNTLPNNPYEA